MKNRLKAMSLAIMLLVCFQYSSAQYHRVHGGDADGKWHVLVEPYVIFPYMNGTVGMGTPIKNLLPLVPEHLLPLVPGHLPSRVDAKVNQTPGDILDKLKMQVLVSGVVYNKDWSISTDVVYMNLGAAVAHETGLISANVTMKQFNWEVAGMYRFLPWLEGGVAMQLNSLKTKIDMTVNIPGSQAPLPLYQEGSKVWVDPSLVGRAYYAFTDSKNWFVQCQANIGGFGVGSNFYWQAQPYVGHYFSRVFQMSAGYRLMSQNYRNGRGDNQFVYDMLTHGPVIKLGFNIN